MKLIFEKFRGLTALVICVALFTACDDGDDGADRETDDFDSETDTDSGSNTDSELPEQPSGACPLGTAYGYFDIMMQAEYSTVSGTVADGLRPLEIPQLVDEQGGCRLLRRLNPKDELRLVSTNGYAGATAPAVVRVDGYIPCKRDDECPDGDTCLEIEICG